MPVEEADREKAFAAERAIALLRAIVIALNSVVYHVFLPKESWSIGLAYFIIVAANVYGLYVLLGRPYERYPVMSSSYYTSALDAVFITVWIAATGGFESPFHLLWPLSVMAVAFRYGPRETVFAGVLYCLSYLALLFALGEVAVSPGVVLLRLGYILLMAALGAMFAKETVSQTRAKVAMRDLAAALGESEERFRRLSDAAFEGIAIHEHGRILECNAAFAALFGRRVDEAVGRTAFDFIAPESHATISERLRNKSDAPYEVKGLRADGRTFDLEIVGRDLPLAGRAVRVTAVRDITERKRAEREARQREALEAANERLREIDRVKTQLINNAAHELGTPLTPIKLQAHMLRTQALGPLNERQARSVSILARNIDHLARLVGDILDVSRLQAGQLKLVRADADLTALLREAAESFHEVARQSSLALEVDVADGLRAHVDTARVTQVAFNLLHNATKFTPAGGSVRLEARHEGGSILVEVSDTGVGLEPDEAARLFRPFSQVHDKMQRTKSGTGLGLYVSRGIVEQHGGAMGVRSGGRDKGATFWFRLPT